MMRLLTLGIIPITLATVFSFSIQNLMLRNAEGTIKECQALVSSMARWNKAQGCLTGFLEVL